MRRKATIKKIGRS